MKILGVLLLLAAVIGLLRVGAQRMNDESANYVRRMHAKTRPPYEGL